MGKPKAWLPFAGELMLPRVVRLLGQVVQPIVVVAAPGQDVPPLPNEVAIVRDEEKGRGPLEGLAAGLAYLTGKVDAAYLSSCDVPFLIPAFVRRLIDLLENHAICVPRVGDRFHPLAAVYRIGVLGTVRELLAENRLRPVFLFDQVSTRIVSVDELADVDPRLQSLRNLNTPEEYDAAVNETQANH
jgi:molybdopterin-guanine dinucleotide biosynthesis protein A